MQLGPGAISNGQTYGGARVLVTGRVTAIAIDPSSHNTIYLGAAQGGIWKSIDKGKTWTWVNGENQRPMYFSQIRVDPNDPKGKDDVQVVNEVHVPLVKNPDGQFRPVVVYISSKDVIHSFKIIAMRVTQDAIPGLMIPLHFKPVKTGTNIINCVQLCGNSHYAMKGTLAVVSGDNQSTSVTSALPQSLTVKVTDQGGNPVAGTSVTFAAPSGSFTGSPATTDSTSSAERRTHPSRMPTSRCWTRPRIS